MHNTCLRFGVVMLCACFPACSGCASSRPSSFYLLSAMAEPGDVKHAFPGANEITIGVGPVELPPYVDRPQIVTRSGSNRLHLAEYDRWAEPLKQGVARVLAENLSTVVGTDHIVLFPWKASQTPAYQIVVDVTRFDSTAAGTAVLTARWTVLEKSGQHKPLTRQSDIRRQAESQSYEAMVGAQSWTVAKLSEEIATAIGVMSQATPAP